MKLYSIVSKMSGVVSVACLGLAYIMAGYWLVELLLLAMTLFWVMLRKQSSSWSASVLLFTYVFLAAIGIVIHLPVFLIAVGCTTALAWWDLISLEQSISDHQPPETSLKLEKYHLRSLGMAAFTGLALVFIGSYIDLKIPFLLTVFLVLVAMAGLTRMPVQS